MEQERRRLTLLDLGVLIAAAALAMAALRWLYPDIRWSMIPPFIANNLQRYGWSWGSIYVLSDFAILLLPAIAIFCLAVLALGIKRPLRDFWSRPGMLACLFGAAISLIGLAAPLVMRLSRGEPVGSPPYQTEAWPVMVAGTAVLVGWVVLLLSGCWRPVKSWVDRAGFATGLILVLAAALVVSRVALFQ